MADSTKEEENLHGKVRKLFQKLTETLHLPRKLAHKERNKNIYSTHTKTNKYSSLPASGLSDVVLHIHTTAEVLRNGFVAIMTNFKSIKYFFYYRY